MRPRLHEKLLAFLLTGVSSGAVWAGPPFITDDPDPVNYQSWEINNAVVGTRVAGQTSAFAPQIDANYGILPGVQFHFQPQMAYYSAPGQHAWGLGDTELGLKYRLTPADAPEGSWEASLYPLVELPTGDANRNLGSGTWREFLPLWVQTVRGNWTFYGGGGYWFNGGVFGQNAWQLGAVALYQFTPKLQLGGELMTLTATTIGGQSTRGFNVGGNYALTEGYSLLFSLGQGLINVSTTDQASFYLALQITY